MNRNLSSFAWEEESSKNFFKDKRIFLTGGTGSLGNSLTKILLERMDVKEVVIYSRDEYKQAIMWKEIPSSQKQRVKMCIGDVRDIDRLKECMGGLRE